MSNSPPKSAQNFGIAFLAFLSFCTGVYLVRNYALSKMDALIYLFLITALPLVIPELIKSFKNIPKEGKDEFLNFSRLKRTGFKLIGLFSTIAVIGFAYYVFPEYQGAFYNIFWKFLKIITPFFLTLCVPYIYLTDYIKNVREDSYYKLGKKLTFQRVNFEKDELKQHFLGWIVKGFFLPLMIVYLSNNVGSIIAPAFGNILNFHHFFNQAYLFIFTVDLIFVSIGYTLSLRLLDSHIRSSEPSFLGWAVALMCYQPFWSLFEGNYISYSDGFGWGYFFEANSIGYMIWGSIILVLISMYSLASIGFGLRFSNLTHRGIITNGMYRFTKHPAYVTKNLSWWLISLPFIITENDPSLALRQTLMLLLLNFVYYMRAKTEERHLSMDPTYVEYAKWMNANGVLAPLAKLLPFIRYKES